MKNLFNFFAIVTLLFMTSCTKEELHPLETDAASNTTTTLESNDGGVSTRAQWIEVTLTVVSESETATRYTVDFSGDDDYTNAIVDGYQTLDFTDGSGNPVQKTFQVESYSGGDRTLLITFKKGRNNIGGLHLDGTQGIVIEDGTIN